MANKTHHLRGSTVHGFQCREHPLYATWAHMLGRCYNNADPAFPNYGGRGIVVDRKWHSFAQFAIDMGLKPSPELTLERIDNDKGYGPENCKWATRTDQCLNRRIFKNNTSGYRGVIKSGDRFLSRFDYESVRYQIGRFKDAETASAAREAFVGLFFADQPSAIAMLDKQTIWCTSSTGIRGVTPHKDGGFVARTTVDGVRMYLGYFKTLEEAEAAIKEAKVIYG